MMLCGIYNIDDENQDFVNSIYNVDDENQDFVNSIYNVRNFIKTT